MKITIDREALVQSVQDVMKAVSPRTTIPILTGIKITATPQGVTLTGSDSDISIESFIPMEDEDKVLVEIAETGSIVLQARFFSEIVKKLPEKTVEIEVQPNFLTVIRSGKAEFSLNGLDAEEYPRLPQIEEENVFEIPTDLLKTIIRQTVFAVSVSETRPILTGVNWRIEDEELICTATDSHRLALRKAKIETENHQSHNVVIPGKSLNELSKILDDSNAPVKIVITANQILFKTKRLLFFSRLLDGNYPETSRLIPTDSKTDIIVNAKEFLQAIDRASLLAREGRNNVVKLTTLSDGIIEISSISPEIGKVTEEIQSESIEGEELKISFSAKYMMDALKALDGTDIKISFTGAMRPFLLRPLHSDSMLQLILPVRTY
ncbi:DNA polymerase III subunit beta [Parageobacillus thermoglucosidasius]|uniref:DNA polymerase III subunit beta n=1 Tax=Parageobacillus thermoglucosidasius TaxID=1426 RepID=UPI000B55D098|nr:DNA polymerase III subunit beta [Parageobacillus thermoglucosidasius]MED4904846.1 DNA polymerase III subunit beta [Parageobacillus thermoglucosidasius]MED4913166.1 DNA polymerase III subunit beta [Parageobacillus thermoglucosidasius]MED4945347.1 DNA polymerase III subunit beta [Parageobacillus thermoglucosidasius]MED4981078.1 DNA polymerase III subunit beta [Parageobacillus thermoglucosidasius]OUM92851.1 MAG: DNA polymerase III subunit beta [Parageobacillus thermoglucosidasius]